MSYPVYDDKYNTGKIYKITSKQTQLIYVGSTIQNLRTRFKQHTCKSKKNECLSREITQYPDAKIELIEEFPCNSKYELENREYRYMTVLCVNKWKPCRFRTELTPVSDGTFGETEGPK